MLRESVCHSGEFACVRVGPSRHGRSLICRILVTALAGGAMLMVPDAASAGRGVASRCPNANLVPLVANVGQIRAAVLCVINADRIRRSLISLKGDPRLRKTALAHSSDMVARGYFAHTSRGGSTFVDRIVAAGYVDRSANWSLGENLAWGAGHRGTAAGVERAWMRSRGHRATILRPGYRAVGIGIQLGAPNGSDLGATFTADFGAKS